MKAIDPIAESDLGAYVDGELDVTRRIEVESYLSENPAIAAKVMADLSLKGELRLALAGENFAGRAETREAARRLERGLAFGRMFNAIKRVAAMAVLAAAGWVAHTSIGPFAAREVNASVPAPAFVEDAVRAHRTTLLRADMPMQPAAAFNAEEIRAATGIVLPQLPKSWTVTDAQVYPSEFGPSVEMAISAGAGRRLSLFAVRPGSFSVQRVNHMTVDGVGTAYWQIGEVAYALIGNDDRKSELDDAAETLARTLY